MSTKGTQGNLTRIVLLAGTSVAFSFSNSSLEHRYEPTIVETEIEKTVSSNFFAYDRIENKLIIYDRNEMLEEPIMNLNIIGKLKIKIKKGGSLKFEAVENYEGLI